MAPPIVLSIVFSLYVMVTVMVVVWAVPDAGVAVTVTVEVPAGVTRTAAALEVKPAQPEIPAASAPVINTSRQSCNIRCCVFERPRLRPKVASPAMLPGHQKASAGRIGLSGLGCGPNGLGIACIRAIGGAVIAPVSMFSAILCAVLLPFSVTAMVCAPEFPGK